VLVYISSDSVGRNRWKDSAINADGEFVRVKLRFVIGPGCVRSSAGAADVQQVALREFSNSSGGIGIFCDMRSVKVSAFQRAKLKGREEQFYGAANTGGGRINSIELSIVSSGIWHSVAANFFSGDGNNIVFDGK
jgi:hypothetical protein